jgi:hypothetical protein
VGEPVTAPPIDNGELFARAREADLEAVAGVRLFKAGRRMRGECPLCGASKGKKADGAFSADLHAGVWKCWACDKGGDVIDLEHALRGRSGETLRDAALRLAGLEGQAGASPRPARPAPVRAPLAPPPPPSEIPGRLWREAVPAKGTPVQRYLLARGIRGPVLMQAVRRLRFHPAAFHSVDDDTRRAVRAPAMLAVVVAPSGPTGGVHATYLKADGSGRDKRLGKKMWGPQADAEGRPGGTWLLAGGEGPLVVGEGIETTLSAAQLYGRPCSAAAALSLGRLQGGWAADRFGRYDVDMPRADLTVPAFTWPPPALRDNWPEILIAVDRDMAPVRRKVRGLGGKTVERAMSGEERAAVCAALAAQHWAAAGHARVRAIAPAAGGDFNDQVMGGSVGGGGSA